MTTSRERGGLPKLIAVPPPQGAMVAWASEKILTAAANCSAVAGVQINFGVSAIDVVFCEQSVPSSDRVATEARRQPLGKLAHGNLHGFTGASP